MEDVFGDCSTSTGGGRAELVSIVAVILRLVQPVPGRADQPRWYGFRAIYRIPTGRSLVHERVVAMLLVVVSSVPLMGASLLLVFGGRAQAWIITTLGLSWTTIATCEDGSGSYGSF